MPLQLLPFQHRVQEHPGGCLAACAQIVLNYYGVEIAQGRLNRLFETQPWGAPFSRLERVERLGFSVEILAGDQSLLEQSVRANLPVIVFVTTGELPYWRESTQHALVVVGLDQSLVYLADPAFAATPQAAQWDEFLLAWSEFDYYCALVRKK